MTMLSFSKADFRFPEVELPGLRARVVIAGSPSFDSTASRGSEGPHNESPQPFARFHTADDPMQRESKEEQSAKRFEELLHGHTILYRALQSCRILNVELFW